jgi:hypothetical protein
MIPDHVLGWMAAVIDLRGKIIRKKNRSRATPQLVLMVETRHYAIVKELGRYTGTSPELRDKMRNMPEWMRKGCTEHCPQPHIHVGDRNGYEWQMPAVTRWTITGAGAAVVLANLMPFLRREQGFEELVQEIATNVIPLTEGTTQGLAAVQRQVQRLHDLGWTIPEAFQLFLRDQELQEVTVT